MIEITDTSDTFKTTFFHVANELNGLHIDSDINWHDISDDIKNQIQKEHGNLYFQIRKAQAATDEAWKAKDFSKFKRSLDKWRLLWITEFNIWKKIFSK